MKKTILLTGTLICAALAPGNATAEQLYQQLRPMTVNSGITQPWVVQLRPAQSADTGQQRRKAAPVIAPEPQKIAKPADSSTGHGGLFGALFRPRDSGAAPVQRRTAQPRDAQPQAAQPQPIQQLQTAQYFPRPQMQQPSNAARQFRLDKKWLPQTVAYDGPEKPGTIIIDTPTHHLYLIERDGQARRYGVGVGKDGFRWSGVERISRKAEWPSWTPPSQMIAREAAKGHYLPARMEGGPANPLGARALYLGSTLYRIHGTNAPWTIGQNVSSGCIRMRNEDVTELYERANVGAKVVVR
jgi:lipoprotein-anchoring transpeptidase ErfK/SrfK